ncbi:sigma-54-dependent Fis family transcriptional regulator [Sorangium sp. So ce119]|uniref:sigma 54-interacting transcriptional regulator n=1 Tax=Sorangium sp. So ce119 TaxID=3133279 RepID=UPI003F5F9E96
MSLDLSGDAEASDPARVQRERDFYRKLLDLDDTDELDALLSEALALIVEIAGARRGYIELSSEAPGAAGPRFWMAHDCSGEQVEAIRAAISRGVIAEALATGETIATASALADPRFRERGSVKKHRIDAVLCAPIGRVPSLGVLYLQERVVPGPFSDEDRGRAELFARHLAALADRLLIRRRANEEADPTLPYRRVLRCEGLVGRSAAIAHVLQQVSLVAPLDVGVLLTGPSGTGKTQLARVLHDSGPRANEPFVELNCAALPETLIESELFGSLPGAHSGATRRVEGKVAAAERGTLFLDEIGELPLAAQAKLLQLLQSKEYFPLGASRPVKANVRIVSATNADLRVLVNKHAFREDLLYRLQVMPIRVPALDERRGDVPELCHRFCARFCQSHRLPELRMSPGALHAAESADWPGNLRQLEHAIETAVIRAAGEGARQVERRHLFPAEGATAGPEGRRPTFHEATRQFQERFLREALDELEWNITAVANALDLTRAHVYNLIRAFGFERRRG